MRRSSDMLKQLLLVAMLLVSENVYAQFGVYVTDQPKVSLEKALPIATKMARSKVQDFDNFLLHSVKPRVFKGDRRGMHWQFLWQEAKFKTHMRGVVVRVYMNDGFALSEEFRE
jgi:hypothetical protein